MQKQLPAEISDYIARAYMNGTPIGMAKKVALEELQQTVMKWMYTLAHSLQAKTGMSTPELRANAMRAVLEHEHLRIYEVRMLLRMIQSGLITPRMDTRFLAADLVECIQQYLEKRTKAVADYQRKQKPVDEFTALPPAANDKQGEATIAKLIERLDLEPVSPSLRAKWLAGGKLTEHERQQIRKEAAGKAEGQAQEEDASSAKEEVMDSTQTQG
jgi:hypothetical protein